MEKQEIINTILDARDTHAVWLQQGKIILNGINLDRLEEPVDLSDCDFSHWCESNKSNISAFSWYQELQQLHKKLHQKYKDLFFDSIRKYNPKTIGELQQRFESLKSESILFNSKLEEIEVDLNNISDESFNDLVVKSLSDDTTQVVEGCAHNNVEDTSDVSGEVSPTEAEENKQEMQEVDIDQYKVNHNPFDVLESIEVSIDAKQKDSKELTDENTAIDITAPVTKQKDVVQALNISASVSRNISLKKQSIVQLKQEKELTTLELFHLEETQKLTQQSVEQLEQYYALKQEEIDAEHTNNGGFLKFKTDKKVLIEDELTDIGEKKSDIKSGINDLEKQNAEDDLHQKASQKETSIEKQFDELKKNKNYKLEDLQEHKKVRENDLIKLKEQLLLLEEEISGMKQDIDRKQQDLLDLGEKEQLKNQERFLQRTEQEKVQQERNDSINDMQKELELLSDQEKIKQTELDTINFQVEELNKNNTLIVETNSDELKELELQQEQKREKLLTTEELKSSKQSEIKDIEIRIVGAERSLVALKADQSNTEQKELETS